MKTKYALFLIVILITAQSCTIFSLNPLYNEEDLLEKSEILGTWQDSEDDNIFISCEIYKDKKYIFRYMEKMQEEGRIDSLSFEAGVVQIGNHYFLDLYPYYDDYSYDEDYFLLRNFIPTHSFVKMDLEDDSMVLYIFSYDRLKELFEQNRIRIRHQMFEDYIVITASTEELQKFIQKYADDENVYDDPGKYVKIR